MPIRWTFKPFQELSLEELYAMLRLRTEVFVVEQQCIFQDMDNKDQQCHHLLGWLDEQLAACTRIVPPGLSYTFPSIGRVVTSPAARGKGMGRELMDKSIQVLESLYGNGPIRIGAQLYLKEFYGSFGFEQTSDIYDEDGIDHIEMTRS